MSPSRTLGWIGAATAAGCVGGAAWGWFGSGGYEANDSMIGTAFLCGCAAALLAVAVLAFRQHRGRRHGR